jgi:hypothetical protein
MTSQSFWRAVLAAALLLVLPAGASAAQRPALIYPDMGLKVAGHEARLSGKAATAARYWIGKRLDTTCMHVSHRTRSGLTSSSVAMTRFAGRVIRLGSTAGKDYCIVGHPLPGLDQEPVAFVALTAAGQAWIEELQVAIAVSSLGPDVPDGQSVPTTDAVVRKDPRHYVALADPGAAPAVGKIGYWSDGAQHFVLALTAPTSHRRLFVEAEGDGVIRTNVLEYTSAVGIT